MEVNKKPWEEKLNQAYFYGKLTGEVYGTNGEFINRLKLMWLAENNLDKIEFGITKFLDKVKLEDVPERFKGLLYTEELCTKMEYKYMITIDGNISPWGRGPNILYADVVPLVVESEFSPLHQKSWIPMVHYVPVKHDLSDLLDKIEWLR
jgi:hypothetical protein